MIKALPRVFRMMLFEESRKVSFGWYLFLVATALLLLGLIDAEKWILCSTGSGALIGGGTLGDKWIETHAPRPKDPQE